MYDIFTLERANYILIKELYHLDVFFVKYEYKSLLTQVDRNLLNSGLIRGVGLEEETYFRERERGKSKEVSKNS